MFKLYESHSISDEQPKYERDDKQHIHLQKSLTAHLSK